MRETYYFIQAILTGVIAMLYDKLGVFLPLMTIFAGLMLLDYISGMLASKKEALEHPGDSKYGWSSQKGLNGIIKKLGYICVVFVAFAIDYIITIFTAAMDRPVEMTAFGLLVIIWFIINEAISICENAGRMGAPVPEWLTKYIASLKDNVDKTGSGSGVNS